MDIQSLINYDAVNSQVIGIIVTIPITGYENQQVVVKHFRCESCEFRPEFGQYEKFCSRCGNKIIYITEKLKRFANKECTEYSMVKVPLPDIRSEMCEIGLKEHLPFDDDNLDCWKFVYKEYLTICNRDYFIPFVEKLNLKNIVTDLKEAKEKLKTILEKYNGNVFFGIAGQFSDF